MFSLSDITHQDDAIKLFKPWWEVLKEYLLYAMLFVTVVINGFKLSQEKLICMPATEGNGTCRYMDNASHSSCFVVEEIKSAAFSEYISLACAEQMDLFAKYFDLILLFFPLFVYVLGAVFYNLSLILYKFKDIHKVILHCTDDGVKALETKLDEYIDNKEWAGNDTEGKKLLKKMLQLQSMIQSTLKIDNHVESNVWRVGPRRKYYPNVTTIAQSNTFSNCCREEGRRCSWFRIVYIMHTFVQLAIIGTYISIIVLFWNESDHETRCVLKETYEYNYDFFLCRHSVRRVYHHLSFSLFFLSVIFIFFILTQWCLLFKGYRTEIRKHLDSSVMDTTTDQRFLMTIIYFCKEEYLNNFCRLYNKKLYIKINRYIADCKYSHGNLKKYFNTHQKSLQLENIAALPFSITIIENIFLLKIVDSDLSMEGTLEPFKDLKGLQQLVLNSCCIENFDVGSLPKGIVLLDILSNPLKEVKGRCPDSLKICSLDQNGCSVKCTNLKNVVILGEKAIRWHAPVNWKNIVPYLIVARSDQLKSNPGEIHIFNTKVNTGNNEKLTDAKCDKNTFDKAVESISFLKGIFSLLHFTVHLHGAKDIANCINKSGEGCPSSVPKVPIKVLIFVFMTDVENNEINLPDVGKIKIVDLIAEFPRLDYLTPAISISLTEDNTHNFSTLELQTSVWNIFYAFVPEASFRDNLIKYLNSEHEDDLASAISGWEDVTTQDFLYKKFYLLPGYPYLDTVSSNWDKQYEEEEEKYSRISTEFIQIIEDLYHLSASVEDAVTYMAHINKISDLQKSIGRIMIGECQISCYMMKRSYVLVAYPGLKAKVQENPVHIPSCVEFKIGEDWKPFEREDLHLDPEYDIIYIKLIKGNVDFPKPVKLDSSSICGQAFVMGYPEKKDSDLIVESHCQVYRNGEEQTCPPQGITKREDQPLFERDLNHVQKLWIMELKQFKKYHEYNDLLEQFRKKDIYVIRLPAKFTEVCRSAVVVCLDDSGEACVKAFYNNRYPESIYNEGNPNRPRELLFQAALKSSIIERTLPE